MPQTTPTPGGAQPEAYDGPRSAGTPYYQVAKPAGLELPEEITLPNGKTVRGSAARVYALLAWSAGTSHCWPIGSRFGPPGAVPTWALREPWSGGNAGDRRLRDLRAAGVSISVESVEIADGQDSHSVVYRLETGAAPLKSDTNPRIKSDPGQRADCLPVATTTAGAMVGELEGLVVWLSRSGRPPLFSGVGVDVTPGAKHRLAPNASLFASLVSAGLHPAEARDRYLRQLRAAYDTGEMSELRQHAEITLWADPAGLHGLPSHEVLAAALRRCGAEILEVKA